MKGLKAKISQNKISKQLSPEEVQARGMNSQNQKPRMSVCFWDLYREELIPSRIQIHLQKLPAFETIQKGVYSSSKREVPLFQVQLTLLMFL